MDSLLQERLLDIVDHEEKTVGIIVDKETNPSTLLSRNTNRVEDINVKLLTHHGRVLNHASQLDVGTREESLVELRVKLELESLLGKVLRRLARSLEGDIANRVNGLGVDETEVDIVILILLWVGVHLGHLGNRSSDVDGGNLLLLEGFCL